MQNVGASLAARQDMSPAEKCAVVERLYKPESAETLAKFKEPEKVNVMPHVKNREYERERQRKLEKGFGLERGT